METVKKGLRITMLNKIMFTLFCVMSSVVMFAQETKTVDVNVGTKGGGGFFGSPVVWVVGIAVFILLLVALMRSGKKD